MLPEDPQEILAWELPKLWTAINVIKYQEDDVHLHTIVEKVKEGILAKYPIWHFLQDWYEVYPSSGNVKVMGHGKFKLALFMEDKEQREVILRQALLDRMEDGSPTEPRI